jgi:probable HAF family extracellular repeat protein
MTYMTMRGFAKSKRFVLKLGLIAFIATSGTVLADGYIFEDIGQISSPGYNNINNNGEVVGNYSGCYIYKNGSLYNIGTLGGSYCVAMGINDNGQVVGWSSLPGFSQNAFLYTNGVMEDLGNGVAYDVNNNGQVTGVKSFSGYGGAHAFIYSNGQMQDLGALPGADYSQAFSINDLAEVVGTADTGSGLSTCFLYKDGAMQDIGSLTENGGCTAYGINDSGQVVGSSQSNEVDGNGYYISHAFLYSEGQMLDLGTLPGYESMSQASAINNKGHVVGTSFTEWGDRHPFLYKDGLMYDLNDLVSPQETDYFTFRFASGINDSGQISGDGINRYGQIRGFILTPSSPIKYVALGDSFSSGEGAYAYEEGTDTSDNLCHRSSAAYSSFLANALPTSILAGRTVARDFIACSGAETEDVASCITPPDGKLPQFDYECRFSSPDNRPQLDQQAFDSSPDLVTVTIGGNDAHFSDIVKWCVKKNDCRNYEPPGWNTTLGEAIPALIRNYVRSAVQVTHQSIKRKATNSSSIIVIGYPQLFPQTLEEQSCEELSSPTPHPWHEITPDEQVFMRGLDDLLNNEIQQAASEEGLHFVPVLGENAYGGFEGHEICGHKMPSWINGIIIHGISPQPESVHPNIFGHVGYRSAILEYIREQ